MLTTVNIAQSLDGYIAREDGSLDWLTPFEDAHVFAGFQMLMGNVDAVVIGRKTYEKVLSFGVWPYAKPVFVLSTTLKILPEGLNGKATLLSMRPEALVEHLATQGFSRLYIDGGKVIQDFLRADCIDELIITTVPVLLGTGIPLFGRPGYERYFIHRGTKTFSNGLVTSRYERRR